MPKRLRSTLIGLSLSCVPLSIPAEGGEIGHGIPSRRRASQWVACVIEELQADHVLSDISEGQGETALKPTGGKPIIIIPK